jgi:hypothetical protein
MFLVLLVFLLVFVTEANHIDGFSLNHADCGTRKYGDSIGASSDLL